MDLTVSVILPAAGSGERMCLTTPKQFCEVKGKSLICHTVEAFLKNDWISKIVVVFPSVVPPTLARCLNEPELTHSKVEIIPGGVTRHRSIFNGIDHLKQSSPNVVIVHDGVRPFVPEEILKQLVQEANLHGAAGPVVPLVSTVLKMDSEGFLEETLDRSKYVASEMPQAFKYCVLLDAYNKCTKDDFDHGTECLALVHKYCKIKPKLIPGNDQLFKVTYLRDLYAVSGILENNRD
ncbi:D-ribitol-5-phosphate cytidylyltransferase-like [Ornithodoros turicata]|uniref:D-ribitol-5-phosphate cytidylyltransferase-like n=1 Tax=Ornithodoros turicata TaxID=34597 RepID=UPI00313955E0